MRIVDGKVIVCSPGRNFVTLKLVTEDGVYGLGDATLNGRELAVAAYLSEHVAPLLVGRDAHAEQLACHQRNDQILAAEPEAEHDREQVHQRRRRRGQK